MPIQKDRKQRMKDGKIQFLSIRSTEIHFTENEKLEILKPIKELKADENGLLRLPRSTLIVGDGTYNDVWHPKEEAEKAYMTMDRQPYILDHDSGILSEIGFMEQPQYDTKTLKLSAVPVVNLNTAHGRDAVAHIQNRLMAGRAPETSVGFWCTETTEKVLMGDEEIESLVARDWEFDHNALVSRGACSPSDGAGIGLKENSLKNKMEEKNMSEENDVKPVEKKPETDAKIKAAKVDMPTKEDFREMMKEELKKEREDAVKDKQIAEFKEAMIKEDYKKAAELNPFKDKDEGTDDISMLKKRIDELERGQSTRTTPTRETIGNASDDAKPEKNTREYKKAQIKTGRGIMRYIGKHPTDNLELSYKADDYEEIPEYMLRD